ncbi:MAG: DUF2799 domain-containing protein [Deltaproteobacteria bacterium]|nr:DUF2799 domain-containing protein [Deltaproteobacteria bacterium]
MRYLIVMAVCIGVLGGCATIPEEQCAKVDWYELGVTDGRAGYAADRLDRHREACAGVKIVPDALRYGEGRRVGLVDYCRPENAVREGLAGHTYRDVCNATFKRIYQAAYDVNALKNRINSNLDEVSNKEAELREKKTSDSRRKELRSDIRELDRRRESLRDDLFQAERELDRARQLTSEKW